MLHICGRVLITTIGFSLNSSICLEMPCHKTESLMQNVVVSGLFEFMQPKLSLNIESDIFNSVAPHI
jgi:hypothetical protein